MREQWKELEEFPDYTISNFGEIVNARSNNSRRMSINQYGIVKISLYKNRNELHTRSLAVLVADAFVRGKDDVFNTPIHLDGDRRNCRADNLMWRPRWFAVRYHRQFDDEIFHKMDAHIWEVNSGEEFYSVKEACMKLGLWYRDVYESMLQEEPIRLTGEEFRATNYAEAEALL